LANVSHELRTPLNVILGFLDLIREGTCGPLAPEGTEALTTIHRHALILLHLINDFLDMSKLQAGAMQLACEPVSVSMIVDEFRDALPILLGDTPVNVRWEIAPDAQVVADSSKVRVIVQNLISNAAKFTVEGEIAVQVRNNGTQTYVSVSDTGPGIQPDDQTRIFDLFEQAEVPGSRRMGGTGIGLYLARTLSRLMGGDLTVESAPGSGSTFTLRLPAAR
jgi:signal transduction histidine kinase